MKDVIDRMAALAAGAALAGMLVAAPPPTGAQPKSSFAVAAMDEQDLRDNMVQHQLVARDIHDAGVLEAMRRVPRSAFVPEASRALAYDDRPLPIGSGQTISQPYIVALMAQAAALRPGDKLLEIGTGSGYAAAVMAQIAGRVDTIERHEGLAVQAREQLERLGYGNVTVHIGDGTLGLPQHAPFDAIVATAGGPFVPPALREQLAIGGRLIMPVGEDTRQQRLIRLTRRGPADYVEEDLGAVAFVPLIGEQGWQPDGQGGHHAPRPR